MRIEEFKKLKVGDQCVIIKTGEPGIVLHINRGTDDVQVTAKRAGIGWSTEWFNYTYIEKI